MNDLFVAFDAGTQSVKVGIYDTQWKCITSHSLPTTLTYPKPGWVEMNPDEYVKITLTCIRECINDIKRQGIDPNRIVSIMGDGVICGICAVDEEGNACTPYINYLDSRTQEDADEINAKNLSIWGKETGNPEALCLFPALFARWFIRNIPDFGQKAVKFVHDAPYILMHLAGLKGNDAFIDWGTMSGWGLGYRVEEKKWSEEQLGILGIDKNLMPRICQPWDVIGTVTKEISEATGLPIGVNVCAGAGDTMQSMLGCGLFESNRGVDVAGTCSMFCVSTGGIVPELSKKGSGLIFNSGSLPNTYFYWGFIRTGGLSLRWFKDNVCQRKGESDYYKTLSEGAQRIEPGSRGVLFLPYLTGGNGENKNASGCFLNLTMDDDQYVMWRSVLEAIGYDYMEITETYRQAGIDLSNITVTEGGSRDDLWNQMKADMLNSNVIRYKTIGGALLTNAIFAAYAVRTIANPKETIKETIGIDRTYVPNKTNVKRYQKLYQMKKTLVTEDLPQAFERLIKMRKIL